MEELFVTDVAIKEVQHLENIHIPLDKGERRHLILTGRNGTGIFGGRSGKSRWKKKETMRWCRLLMVLCVSGTRLARIGEERKGRC